MKSNKNLKIGFNEVILFLIILMVLYALFYGLYVHYLESGYIEKMQRTQVVDKPTIEDCIKQFRQNAQAFTDCGSCRFYIAPSCEGFTIIPITDCTTVYGEERIDGTKGD